MAFMLWAEAVAEAALIQKADKQLLDPSYERTRSLRKTENYIKDPSSKRKKMAIAAESLVIDCYKHSWDDVELDINVIKHYITDFETKDNLDLIQVINLHLDEMVKLSQKAQHPFGSQFQQTCLSYNVLTRVGTTIKTCYRKQ